MTGRVLLATDPLVAVDIKSFREATRDIQFDVYMKLSHDNIVHVFSRATGLDYKRLAGYVKSGVKYLYIHPNDQQAYNRFIAQSAQVVLKDPSAPFEKKIATLLNVTEQNISEIFSQLNLEDETVNTTHNLVVSYVDLMARSPQTLSIILKLVSHGDYLYYHSIATAIFSLLLAKACGQFNLQSLENIGLGGFLHDIGSIQLPKELVCSPTDLTSEQWAEMHSHPKVGLKMIENTKAVPEDVKYIVYQHHEQLDGHGYPNGIKGNCIYYPAKIVAVADSFSALISERPFRPANSVQKAISIQKQAKEKYDQKLVNILASVFSRTKAKG